MKRKFWKIEKFEIDGGSAYPRVSDLVLLINKMPNGAKIISIERSFSHTGWVFTLHTGDGELP